MNSIQTENDLIAVAAALVGPSVTLSAGEKALKKQVSRRAIDPVLVDTLRNDIIAGNDPLGDAFAAIRSAIERRAAGAVYTPAPIVRSMMAWLSAQATPVRIVDPGAGSGRFILTAGEAFPNAELVAVEMDPLAALMLRANLSARGWTDRTTVLVKDYREVKLARRTGTTAFIGNPPYVRHHDIAEDWKVWYASNFAEFGIKASALAGLHLHFFLQTRRLAKAGDVGAFITSAEWMDVNYGSALRRLLLDELGGVALHVLEPTVEAFPGTATTAAITCFRVGETDDPVRVRDVGTLEQLNGLTNGTDIPRERLQAASRWSIIVRPAEPVTAGDIELGELFRVHRGQVTGANDIWIAGEHARGLPERVKLPAVTKAKDLIQAGAQLQSTEVLRRVIDLPAEFDDFTKEERSCINAFLSWAKLNGADQSYIAQHRKTWWSVGLKAPAPILCTYMARRPPQFTLNACDARHINIAHGLYPREPLAADVIARLVTWLNENINTGSGRTYAGGLTKFEPKEIERLRIPRLETLLA
ncbi:Eco57I restriction-modification methylase domain-containing protein [Burkholderia ubonensis]|uniref:Eco57I restriction-modification methylase domain-containing protein n=1 Tax=Burkholderia ubonensis TaxID=101571 RepID=UPI0007557428|nr:N-6 DNA methylase [Burkholderia ubonensis]KVA76469.1 SAM-dependent methyltransferase [Burkholderia ubonensis]KVO55300.1 SAM-dependent methyltransferase [Burkholderia ubonensis]KVT01275.1 SAM-dependent methyltransferase [Burkholderia ubonensis]KVT16228.1 SAM-dependent methyltransferase [Burkholderia ubonensis]KVT29389.1 SAM-dependent methyltransferase [Burkholderia ubonensis]